MQKKVIAFFISTRMMAMLLLLFAISIGAATFVENSYDTITAKRLIYHAVWFKVMMGLLVINFAGNIKRYRLWRKEKWSILMIHFGMIFIIIGAGVTHYFGFEGIMPLEEGKTSNTMYSSEPYFQMMVHDQDFEKGYRIELLQQPSEILSNYFEHEGNFEEYGKIKVEYVSYFSKAAFGEIQSTQKEGKEYIEIVVDGMQSKFIANGESIIIGNQLITFNNSISNAINIAGTGDQVKIAYQLPIVRFSMSTQTYDTLSAGMHLLERKHLHDFGGLKFVYKGYYPNANIPIVKDEENGQDLLIVNLTYKSQTKKIHLFGGAGVIPSFERFVMGDLIFNLAFGPKQIELPFSVHLDDFILETYPGSNSPSGYRSNVHLLDERNGINESRSIYMNHVLSYDGYRVFQSSYSIENGVEESVFSINHDFYGTWISYCAYILLGLGFLITLFNPSSRFVELRKKVRKIRTKRKSALTTLFIGFGLYGLSQQYTPISQAHCDQFDQMLVLSYTGRIQPCNSLTIDVLHKLSRKDYWEVGGIKLSPTQVFLDMFVNPSFWLKEPILKFDPDTRVGKVFGIDGEFCAVADIITIDSNGLMVEDKIIEKVEVATQKPMGTRNKFDNEIIKLNDKLNIILAVIRGSYLRVIPIQDGDKVKWIDWSDSLAKTDIIAGHESMTGITTDKLIYSYLSNLVSSKQTDDYANSNEMIDMIIGLQRKGVAKDQVPSEKLVQWEVFYNKLNLFSRLKNYYALLSVFLLGLTLWESLSSRKLNGLKWTINSLFGFLFLGFLLHTLSLGMRWYIIGHAPWSNGYEALTFIAWASLLAGFIFVKFSRITLAATGLLAFFILMTAGHSNYDPQLSNLEPVLKSYWLVIHVACLTISYGFFGLGFILSLTSMGVFAFRKNNTSKIKRDKTNSIITELTHVNEMTLTVGLMLAAIGTFLGGVWANESWGRYWGWDAKETWALVIVIVYAFILHMRFVPGLRGKYVFNLASILGFTSVLFTFIGVNFYLTKGLHSYARGDAPGFAVWVWMIILGVAALLVTAGIQNRRSKNDYK